MLLAMALQECSSHGKKKSTCSFQIPVHQTGPSEWSYTCVILNFLEIFSGNKGTI